MALVDTDVLIDVLRNHAPTVEWLRALPEAPDVPGFVAMELYQGCHDKREADAVSKLLRRFLVVCRRRWMPTLPCCISPR